MQSALPELKIGEAKGRTKTMVRAVILDIILVFKPSKVLARFF
jgi:hypothetical protein